MDEAIGRTSEKRPFKLYANISSPTENAIHGLLMQAFSEMDPCQRPWCGIGLEMGLLAVSSTNLIIADVREVNGVQQAVVQVPQNWREQWHIEIADGARRQLSANPCERAERTLSAIQHNLYPLLRAGDESMFPSIKYLIIFPDEYIFSGPKEFSIVEREGVLTLSLKHCRDLVEAIRKPLKQQSLDPRKYRMWIEGSVLGKSDDSIAGTWLDPVFDKVEEEPAKTERWWLRRLRPNDIPPESQEVAFLDHVRTTPIRQKPEWHQSKLILMAITGTIIGMVGWQLYTPNEPRPSESHSNPALSPPRPDNSINAAELIQTARPRSSPPLPEHHNQAIVPPTEVSQSNDVQRRVKLTGKNHATESARKLGAPVQDAEDSELKRQKIELQIHEAIQLRAVSGVTVYFAGDTARLQGRVETESQKSAAEKAARSVPGVKKVRSSIEVNFLLSEES